MAGSINQYLSFTKRVRYRTFMWSLAKWILLGSIIGVIAGSMSALLLNTNDFLTDTREANPFLIFFLPLGGIVIGYIYKKYGKESDKGNNLVYEHVHHGEGRLPLVMGPIVFISTFITHLFGGSTGREGAAIQMGGSISEAVIRFFKLGKIDRKILLMSGISGGFGSAFGTPLTGAILGMEVVSVGKMKYEALVPCFVSSFVGHFVTMAWGVEHEHHVIKSVPELTATIIVKVIAVSILFSFTSVLYTMLRHAIQKTAEKYLKNPITSAFIGGLIIVALVLIIGSRDYTGRGLKMVDQAFEGQVPPLAFLGKLVFTAVTMGTGFRGGEVIPLFFMGATLGNTLSGIIGLPTSFLAALGLIAVFCGASNVPISCFILSIELFEGTGFEFFFIACLVSYIFSGHHSVWPSQKLYEPKSKMLNIVAGETIESINAKKTRPKI